MGDKTQPMKPIAELMCSGCGEYAGSHIDAVIGALKADNAALIDDLASYKMAASECELECKALRAQRDTAEAKARESALEALAAYGQANDAYAAQLKAEAMAEKLAEALRITRQKLSSISHSEFDGVWSDADFDEETKEADGALAEYEASKAGATP